MVIELRLFILLAMGSETAVEKMAVLENRRESLAMAVDTAILVEMGNFVSGKYVL